MSRYTFSPGADRDLDSIREHLDPLPRGPAQRIAQDLHRMLRRLGEEPHLGFAHSELTLLAGSEVRSRSCPPYRIYYTVSGRHPEVLGIIHTSRDLPGIIEKRLQ